ncbi:FAD synthetase [Schizosaccharomyces japonicus yFS275]|uniref:FAD synthase n=1 Tax=Schizosaccharomyces japonicus (strain yFS275 / FY16936) TaxID=402676 RepID=B6JZA8_SCHJY|nr:FAD synthetase [Schizosaccharomyces japonicus yFS275]EEB06876.1 FAD synthetase [Schizosaccharomyces japonicus yFS275]
MEAIRQLGLNIQNFLNSKNSPNYDELLFQHVEYSLDAIQTAVDKFGLTNIAMSFNGGKDCLVLFALLVYVVWKHAGEESESILSKIPFVFVRPTDEFQEMDDFVFECQKLYNLKVVALTDPMKEAFRKFMQTAPTTKAIFIGIRRLDPHGMHRITFEPTDHGWPQFTRIQPILDWSYHEVWEFILKTKVKYCRLYDKGYTSLGGKRDTAPNPELRKPDGTYFPAYELKDEKLERSGRNLTVPFERSLSRDLYDSSHSSQVSLKEH